MGAAKALASLHICTGRFAFAFVNVPKSHDIVLSQMAILRYSHQQRRLVSLHISAGIVTGQEISIKISCNGSEGSGESVHVHRLSRVSSLYQNLMCWLTWRFNTILCKQQRLWLACTFARAYLSHCHCTKISCATSNGN